MPTEFSVVLSSGVEPVRVVTHVMVDANPLLLDCQGFGLRTQSSLCLQLFYTNLQFPAAMFEIFQAPCFYLVPSYSHCTFAHLLQASMWLAFQAGSLTPII